jgi:integrase
MSYDLSKVRVREGLRPRAEPYWHRIRKGCFVGFRPATKGGAGYWIARAYNPETNAKPMKALGNFGGLPGNDRFAAAKQEAEKFADLVESGGEVRPEIVTVADACKAYAETRPEAEGRFRRFVYADPVASVKLEKLRRRHLAEWRKRLEEAPAQVSRAKAGDRRTRPRAQSTINREMAVLRAALSKVLPKGHPNTEAAWQEALRAIQNADGRRDIYLDREGRRRLLEFVSPEAKPFVQALCLLPLRPGAVAALTVADFDKRTSLLAIKKDKNGKPRVIRVPQHAAELFAAQCAHKLPAAPIFMRANGTTWNRDSWKVPIARAVAEAGLSDKVTAYTLRHSTITDLVGSGEPLLRIAQISGTSAEMIERHYGQLQSDAAMNALSLLEL